MRCLCFFTARIHWFYCFTGIYVVVLIGFAWFLTGFICVFFADRIESGWREHGYDIRKLPKRQRVVCSFISSFRDFLLFLFTFLLIHKVQNVSYSP